MFENFKADLRHHLDTTGSHSARHMAAAFFEMSIWAVAVFRFGKWAHSFRARLIRWPLMAVYFLLYRVSQAFSGISISMDSEIGPGLVIHNHGGVIVHGRVGRDCIFVQGAQMISRADGAGRGWPSLGDRVYVAAGAKIVGDVTIGSDAKIGVNAVVLTDVPAGAMVMPPECRVITKMRAAAAAPAAQPSAPRSSAPIPAPIRERVVLMLQETVCQGRKVPGDDSTSLLESGLLDSLGILMLADEIKARFNCVVSNDELSPENLDSVGAITSYLIRKGASNN